MAARVHPRTEKDFLKPRQGRQRPSPSVAATDGLTRDSEQFLYREVEDKGSFLKTPLDFRETTENS